MEHRYAVLKPAQTAEAPAAPGTGSECSARRDSFFCVSSKLSAGLSCSMALVRILVDGYSLLHGWPELAPGRPRFSAAAREELIRRLTQYQDAVTTPITVFFDGARPKGQSQEAGTSAGVEVLYSHAGQTADQMIERAAYRFAPYGEVLAVTDDFAERDTVISLGGLACSCANFIEDVGRALSAQAEDIKDYNRKERHRFRTRR